MRTDSQIEAILFWKAEPVTKKELGVILGIGLEEIEKGIKDLEQNLSGRGFRLMIKDDAVMLGTVPEMSALIEKLGKEELVKDLGKAGLETLSIILYRGPVSRRDVDYIRGVNSSFILRHLLVRGLVERVTNEKDERIFMYRPTFELLSYLGVVNVEHLPEYLEVRKEVEDFTKSAEINSQPPETREVAQQ